MYRSPFRVDHRFECTVSPFFFFIEIWKQREIAVYENNDSERTRRVKHSTNRKFQSFTSSSERVEIVWANYSRRYRSYTRERKLKKITSLRNQRKLLLDAPESENFKNRKNFTRGLDRDALRCSRTQET